MVQATNKDVNEGLVDTQLPTIANLEKGKLDGNIDNDGTIESPFAHPYWNLGSHRMSNFEEKESQVFYPVDPTSLNLVLRPERGTSPTCSKKQTIDRGLSRVQDKVDNPPREDSSDSSDSPSILNNYVTLTGAYILFGDDEYLFMFQEAYKAAMHYLFNDPWYVEVNMNSAAIVWPLFNSLQAFWPGLQVLAGDIDPAIRTHTAFFTVWKKYGFTPEGFNLATLSVQHGQRSYPLRPELIESTYWLYKATRDSRYLDAGRDIVASLQYGARCPCGYCHISDVESHKQEDHMESFFLAETVKYLWLLFDLAVGPNNLVENGPYNLLYSISQASSKFSSAQRCINEEKSALLHLKEGFSIELEFFSFPLPPPTFSLLPSWETGLGHLSRLIHLNLSYSGFSGQIPMDFSNLTNLVSFNLSAVSSWMKLERLNLRMLVQNLTSLRELVLDGVNISFQGNECCKVLSAAVPNLVILNSVRFGRLTEGAKKYIFSTEGHLLPATPQISLVQEHCSYLGAFCKGNNTRHKSPPNVRDGPQESNVTRFHGLCAGPTHGQKYGISYMDETDTTHDDESPNLQEATVVQSHSLVLVSNPKDDNIQKSSLESPETDTSQK
ncbi:hypothetical protein GIB67_025533 [Kingdonia uniflora]|uniref:alpha-1,2-Mannosidase n=1 Tax=Kingdonia uniflora TaxID=39325 RepID=A0A7J7M0H8_9MAGN|nr:hypothetical protein GIB67_025533 [Kingdonia uniflora]